ncbi:hypothetical protein GYH30_025111 [Glycine max]|nr:hypothetical protein GYH30_025111 [Glycine max]
MEIQKKYASKRRLSEEETWEVSLEENLNQIQHDDQTSSSKEEDTQEINTLTKEQDLLFETINSIPDPQEKKIFLNKLKKSLEDKPKPKEFITNNKFDKLSTTSGSKLKINYKLSKAIIENQGLSIETNFLLVKNLKNEGGITTWHLGKKITFDFSTKPITRNINFIEKKISQINFLKDEVSFNNIKIQLEKPQIKEKIQFLLKHIQSTICFDLPHAFWYPKKHIVDLPNEKDFREKQVPKKFRPIQMNEELLQYCQKEIKDLLDKGLIRKSKSLWSCSAFYVKKQSKLERGTPQKLSCRLRNPVPPYEEEEEARKVLNWLYQSHPEKGFHPPKPGHQPKLGHLPINQNSKMEISLTKLLKKTWADIASELDDESKIDLKTLIQKIKDSKVIYNTPKEKHIITSTAKPTPKSSNSYIYENKFSTVLQIEPDYWDKNPFKATAKAFPLGFHFKPTTNNKTRTFYEFILIDSNSVSIKHFKDPNDPLLNTHSAIQILKVLQPRHFGSNLNEYKKKFVPFDPIGYTY